MQEFILGEVIGEQVLEALFPDGRTISVTIYLGRPQEQPGESFPRFYCPWLVKGYGSGIVRAASGLDSMSAILYALEMIGIELEVGRTKDGIRFTCDGEPHGFPKNFWPKEAPGDPEPAA